MLYIFHFYVVFVFDPRLLTAINDSLVVLLSVVDALLNKGLTISNEIFINLLQFLQFIDSDKICSIVHFGDGYYMFGIVCNNHGDNRVIRVSSLCANKILEPDLVVFEAWMRLLLNGIASRVDGPDALSILGYTIHVRVSSSTFVIIFFCSF